jgi:hypothetical protein
MATAFARCGIAGLARLEPCGQAVKAASFPNKDRDVRPVVGRLRTILCRRVAPLQDGSPHVEPAIRCRIAVQQAHQLSNRGATQADPGVCRVLLSPDRPRPPRTSCLTPLPPAARTIRRNLASPQTCSFTLRIHYAHSASGWSTLPAVFCALGAGRLSLKYVTFSQHKSHATNGTMLGWFYLFR